MTQPMDVEELAELMAGARAYQTATGTPNLQLYRDDLPATKNVFRQFWSPERPGAIYLFTTESGWDVFELMHPELPKKLVGWSLSEHNLRLHKMPPRDVIRHLVAARTQDEVAGTKIALGLPPIDRLFVITLLLTDDDRYLPLQALYYGRPTEKDERDTNIEIVKEISSDLNRDQHPPPLRPAPKLSPEITGWIETFRSRALTLQEQEHLTDLLLELEPIELSESISRMMPFTYDEAGKWLASSGPQAERIARAHAHVISTHPKIFQGQDLREAPWKTGWMLPRPYDPQLDYQNTHIKDPLFKKRS